MYLAPWVQEIFDQHTHVPEGPDLVFEMAPRRTCKKRRQVNSH